MAARIEACDAVVHFEAFLLEQVQAVEGCDDDAADGGTGKRGKEQGFLVRAIDLDCSDRDFSGDAVECPFREEIEEFLPVGRLGRAWCDGVAPGTDELLLGEAGQDLQVDVLEIVVLDE